MATDCMAQLTFRSRGLRAPVVARLDVPHASSEGARAIHALGDYGHVSVRAGRGHLTIWVDDGPPSPEPPRSELVKSH